MSENLRPSWTFAVGDAADIPRILDETPQNSPWCIIADKYGTVRLIALRTDFCARFRAEDGIRVVGEDISPDWGYSHGYVARMSGRGSFVCHYHSGLPIPENWRLYSTGPADADADADADTIGVQGLLEQLEAAEKYLMRTPVRVYVKEG